MKLLEFHSRNQSHATAAPTKQSLETILIAVYIYYEATLFYLSSITRWFVSLFITFPLSSFALAVAQSTRVAESSSSATPGIHWYHNKYFLFLLVDLKSLLFPPDSIIAVNIFLSFFLCLHSIVLLLGFTSRETINKLTARYRLY